MAIELDVNNDGAVDISRGGTGGTTALAARANLLITEEVEAWGDLNRAVDALSGGSPVTLTFSTNQTLTGNLTIPSHIELVRLNGATITTTSYTLNANGASVDIGEYLVFTGTGTVTGLKEARPEWFSGNNAEKITSAIVCAINSSCPVIFTSMLDITGLGPITIPTKTRDLLVIQGIGGGIQKDDAGYVFTNQTLYDGDISIFGMKFQSVGGAGAILWNGNRVIRIASHDNVFMDWDTVIEADTTYIQQFDSRYDRVIGGQGWVATFRESFGSSFIGMTIEDRNTGTGNGIGNSVDTGALQNRNLNISNCLIENNSGTAIRLAGSFKTTISDNYFELNGEDIDMQSFPTWPHYGLRITGNMLGGAAKTTPSILWGKIAGGSTTGKGGAVSESNASDHKLHSIYSGNTGYISASGDYSAGDLITGNNRYYINHGQYVAITNPDNSLNINGGFVRTLSNTLSVTIGAGATVTAKVLFADALASGDSVSVYLNNMYDLNILGYSLDVTPGSYGVNVLIKNTGAVSLTRTIIAVVTQFKL